MPPLLELSAVGGVRSHIPHPVPHFCRHFRRALDRGRIGSYRVTLSCTLTSCCYKAFPLITTSCELGSPFLPLQGEPHGFRFPTGRAPDDNQAPGLKGPQTMTDIALIPGQGPHQVLMTARDHAAGALVVCRQPLEDVFLPSGE